MRTRTRLLALTVLALLATLPLPAEGANGSWTVVGWNNLGMHCMDSDYSVFSILPPYNTIHAQLVDPSGNLITSGSGYVVTYQAIADPTGSINTTSVGKSNFWQYALSLFGLGQPLPADTGLTGLAMPGAANTPRPMTWDAANGWWVAEGIPLTPYDDSQAKNPYPMMRIQAETTAGDVLASTDIVLPVSDEMDCKVCHASNSGPAARPGAGWVNDPDPERDYRLNVLRLHDERRGASQSYATMLTSFGYNAGGLYPTVTTDGKPILCATCHGSNALATAGYPGVPQLTTAIHSLHAGVVDPVSGLTLNDTTNRSACYRCHPGSSTKCLRGAMGNAVAADGSMAMQCQGCHGLMSTVGAAGRQGWLDEPTCQNCHTGTAMHNNGQIRYTDVYDSNGQRRQAVDQVFATNANTPAPGVSLYRFSTGHGGLKCEACHGSTHAEFPTSHLNDNVQSVALQGHSGVLVECASCHGTQPNTASGGPHGLHPVGQDWIGSHKDVAENGGAVACQACHGADYRGTVLSRSKANRILNTEFGSKNFWTGFQIGCYTCHNGPSDDHANSNRAPVASNTAATTSTGIPVPIQLVASDADGNPLTLRVVSQPSHGTAGLTARTATYFPDAGFSGADSFTFAAWDGSTDSNLATVLLTVGGGSPCTITPAANVPATATVGQAVTFSGSATLSGCNSSPTYDWNFGDGSAHGATANATHAYAAAGTFTWTFTVAAGATTASVTRAITVSAGSPCTITPAANVPATATVGQAVTFAGSATLSGCNSSPTYDWNFGDGSAHGATANATHTYAAAGTFTWTFTVTAGATTASVTRAIAVASTCTPPTITRQPQSQTIQRGERATISVVASGTAPLHYQWFRGSSGNTEHPISGAISSTFTTPQLSETTTYWVRVNNACGAVNSVTATITVRNRIRPHVS